ncbi:MAG: cyclase family protein [Candidatus Omnitrophica bacterium]|nr:cyclase family protein [Candidatus Omnitrophota bacterium]
MKVKYLSYIFDKSNPIYRNTCASLLIRAKKSISKGDSCNVFRFSMESHWGTHVDAPAHFFNKAKKIADYKPDFWLFKKPCVINLPVSSEEVIELKDIKSKVNNEHDLVLIQTGFSKFRGSRTYSFNNPVVDPEVGLWLRTNRPKVRAVGFDFISIGSRQKKEMAKIAHRAFLNPKSKGKPILIIEDMDLRGNLLGLKEVWLAPLLVKGIDSAPCVALGILRG